MADNKFEMKAAELTKRLTIQVTVRFSTMFRLRWWLFLGLLKIVRRISPIRLRVYQEPKYPLSYYDCRKENPDGSDVVQHGKNR